MGCTLDLINNGSLCKYVCKNRVPQRRNDGVLDQDNSGAEEENNQIDHIPNLLIDFWVVGGRKEKTLSKDVETNGTMRYRIIFGKQLRVHFDVINSKIPINIK